jgi:Flp pilus assembly pilin Flp
MQSIATSKGAARQTAMLVRRLAIETDGQDLIEYALLTTFIGFAGAAGWALMQTGLGTIYNSYVAAVWNMWNPPDPVGGGA